MDNSTPQGQPRPNQSRNQPQNQPGNRAAFVLQLVLLFLMMALSGLIGLIWFGGEQLLFPPTPTPTATAGLGLAPTPDFRATMIAEDLATQVAYSTLAIQLGLSPLSAPTPDVETMIEINIPIIADSDAAGTATAVAAMGNGDGDPGLGDNPVVVVLPVVVNGGSLLPTPTETPVVESVLLPVEIPAEVPTETPVTFSTETPIAPPTETPTVTPTPFFVETLQAVVATPNAVSRTGPSNLNVTATTFPGNTTVTLSGRDETGEWVYICCDPPYWVRQIFVQPSGNGLPPGAPSGANPNDVRWLRVQPPPPGAVPIQTPTALPDNSFPLARRDRNNSGRVPNLPNLPMEEVWLNAQRAEQAMLSPIVVGNDKVIVASNDRRLYAFGLFEGNQLWRTEPLGLIRFAPALQDNYVYFADEQARVFGFQDTGAQAEQRWQQTVTGVAKSNIYIAGDRLYVITSVNAAQDNIVILDRFSGNVVHAPYVSSTTIAPWLTFGNQLLYMGDPVLRALDINDFSAIWTREDIRNLTAPPVFVLNGPNALAELYVADNQADKGGSRLHAINANTGQTIWTVVVGREITGIAVNQDAIYVTGENFIRAIPRQSANFDLWEFGIDGSAVGGMLLDHEQILIVTNRNVIQTINFSGQSIGKFSIRNGQSLVAAPAVSGQYLYLPVNDSNVYAYRGQP